MPTPAKRRATNLTTRLWCLPWAIVAIQLSGCVTVKEPDEGVVSEALENEIPPVLDYLAAELGEDDYLVGNRFSVADIAVTTGFVNFRIGGESVDASRWPTLATYVDRVFSRPAIKTVVEGDLAT